MRTIKHLFTALVLAASMTACGGEASDSAQSTPADPSGLTAAQLENGIGPVSSLDLAAVDAALAAKGLEVFTVKCSACHKMAERYVGPGLADVTTRRSPEFIMNMILNPEEMTQKHPAVREMMAQYMSAMPNQRLTEEDARAVLEYLRTQADGA